MPLLDDLRKDLEGPDKGAKVVVKFIGFVAQLIADSVDDADDAKSLGDELKANAQEMAQEVFAKACAAQQPSAEQQPTTPPPEGTPPPA